MKERIMITAGKKYIDIDAYAGIFAYKHLLENLGYTVYAYNTAIENESVAPIIKEMNLQFDSVTILPTDKFIVLDVSNPDFFSEVVSLENIVEIIDHHTGFEDYWKEREVNTCIEFIGSICTIIYERYVKYHKESLLNECLCKLLIAGILDNTLNLKASITTDRDRIAVQNLKRIGHIGDNWGFDYFKSCYQDLEFHLKDCIERDIKIEHVSDYLPNVFGQLIVLDIKTIFDNLNIVKDTFSPYDAWIFNVMSLGDGKSYLFFCGTDIKERLEILFQQKIEGNYLILDSFLLRKQIMKLAREKDQNI